MDLDIQQPAKRIELSAVVRRADGTIEDHGIIASYDRRWWRRAVDRLHRRRGRVTQTRKES